MSGIGGNVLLLHQNCCKGVLVGAKAVPRPRARGKPRSKYPSSDTNVSAVRGVRQCFSAHIALPLLGTSKLLQMQEWNLEKNISLASLNAD